MAPKEKDATPLPFTPMLVVSIIYVCESFAQTMIYPFILFMVDTFEITQNDKQIGIYVGILASSFSIAQLLSSYAWGYASDKFGRRPILLFGLFGNAVCTLLFGLSQNYYWAIATRFLSGLLNGNIGVARTFLSENVDSTNQSKGFSFISLMWGIGIIIGPAAGGFLSQPHEKYPDLVPIGSFFHSFPFLIPCLLSAIVTMVGFIIGYFKIKETLRKDEEDEASALLPKPKKVKLSFLYIIKNYPVSLYIIVCYAALVLCTIIYVEVFSLWSATATADGGLGFDSTKIGLSLAIVGFVLVPYQLWGYQFVSNKLKGPKYSLQLGSLINVFCFAMFPLLNRFESQVGLWAAIMALNILRVASTSTSYTSIFIMISNSVPSDVLGSVNGLGEMVASAAKAAGPSLGGSLFAWSLTNNMSFPFNYWFTFFITSLVSLGCFLLPFKLDNAINHRMYGEIEDVGSTVGMD